MPEEAEKEGEWGEGGEEGWAEENAGREGKTGKGSKEGEEGKEGFHTMQVAMARQSCPEGADLLGRFQDLHRHENASVQGETLWGAQRSGKKLQKRETHGSLEGSA